MRFLCADGRRARIAGQVRAIRIRCYVRIDTLPEVPEKARIGTGGEP